MSYPTTSSSRGRDPVIILKRRTLFDRLPPIGDKVKRLSNRIFTKRVFNRNFHDLCGQNERLSSFFFHGKTTEWNPIRFRLGSKKEQLYRIPRFRVSPSGLISFLEFKGTETVRQSELDPVQWDGESQSKVGIPLKEEPTTWWDVITFRRHVQL